MTTNGANGKTPIIGQNFTHDAIPYHQDQFVIPRHWDNLRPPAGRIVGLGQQTRLIGTNNTKNLSKKFIVVNEGYNDGHTLSQHGSTPPAVMQPLLQNCSIQGYDDSDKSGGEYSGSGYVKANTFNNNRTSDNLYDAIGLDGGGGLIEHVGVSHIPGCSLFLNRPGDDAPGRWGEYERLRWLVRRFTSYNCFAGPYINATDCSVSDCESVGFRDWGFRIGQSNTTGAVQYDKLHAFAGGWEGAYCGGAAILVDGDECHCTDCHGADGVTGLCFNGSFSDMKGFHSLNCANHNVRFKKGYNSLISGSIKVGFLDFANGAVNTCTRITSSGYETNGDSVGAEVGDQHCTIVYTFYRFASLNTGGIAIRLNDVNAGNNVIIQGVRVLALGGESTSGPVGLKAMPVQFAQLNRSRIDLTMIGGNVGIDFSPASYIGSGNHVVLTTELSTRVPIIWPSNQTWNTTPSTDPNVFYVNGERYYKQ